MNDDKASSGGLFAWIVTHPVAVTMLFSAALVFGYVSYKRLAIDLMPDIAYPTLTVRTAYDGAAPQEVEGQISRPIEEALSTLDGLVSLESRSRAGTSDVVLGFDWGTDMGAAGQTIRENLQTTFLPPTADRPLLLRYDPSLDPFLRLTLSVDPESEDAPEGEAALYMLREVAEDQLKRELEGMRGIAAVRVEGGLEREIRIEVQENWLAARKVTLEEVHSALASENINISGGSIIEGDVEYLIRTLNQYKGIEELHQVKVRRSDGELVALPEVALLSENHKERTVFSRLDGGEAVQLELFKEADANVVEVARGVHHALFVGPTSHESRLPPGLKLAVLEDQAAFIELAVGNLASTAMVGGFFAVAVLYLFLRDFRATLIVGAAIPVSVIIAFAPLYLLDVSLNLMSLGGLALGVGMLVDNAVVVLESITRYKEEGEAQVEAATHGVADVAVAVVASTLTTVAVFLPIAFVEGVAGELFGDLSLAVVSSLVASLLVALVGVPMLAALEFAPGERSSEGLPGLVRPEGGLSVAWLRDVLGRAFAPVVEDWKASGQARSERKLLWLAFPWVLFRTVLHGLYRAMWALLVVAAGLFFRVFVAVGGFATRWGSVPVVWLATRFQAGHGAMARRYSERLPGLIKRPGFVLGGAVAIFLVSVVMLPLLGSELIPQIHQGRFTVELAMPVGTPLQATAEVADIAERIVRDHKEVEAVYATVGAEKRADTAADEGEHTARLQVKLVESGDLAALEARVMGQLRSSLRSVPRAEITMTRPALFSFRTPVEIVIFGYDLEELRRVSDRVVSVLSGTPGLADVTSSLTDGHPEIRIVYDRARLHRLGLDPASVAERVRDKVQGVEPTQIHQGPRRVALRVQLVEPDRASVAQLRSININPQLRPVIPLDSVADFEEGVGPSEIRRVDQQRAIAITANLAGFDLGSAGDSIREAMDGADLPPSTRWEVGGQSAEMTDAMGNLQLALLLAVFLVYVIMASTFESIIHPFVILFSVPLATVGAVVGLLLGGASISVVVFIGLIVLAGVVVNNAIVLVDTINRFRSDGVELDEAIATAGALRLRPILITTTTTVLGLLPLALGSGAGAELQGPLALTVIGGLLSSTLLTLVVVPTLYRLLANVARVQV